MFKLFKVTAIVSMATLVGIGAGIIRAKFTAITLGPAGVGIFSQAFQFQQLIITMASLSIGLGVVKYVSKYRAQGDLQKAGGVISAALIMQLGVSSIVMFLAAVFCTFASHILFATDEYQWYLIILLIGIPFSIIASTMEAIFFGFEDYKAFTKGRSWSGILALIPLFIFIALAGIKGGFIYLGLSGIITFLVYWYLFRKGQYIVYGVKEFLSALSRRKEVFAAFGKDLLFYGGASFATGILGLVNIVFVRSLIIRFCGAEGNGYYQVVFALTSYYLAFFTNGLWSYFYPKISSLTDMRKYSVEMNHAFRFSIFGIVPLITAIFLMKGIIIRVLFSDKFMDASGLFSTQLLGDIFFLFVYIQGTSLLASTRLKAYVILGAIYSILFIGIFLLLNRFAGLRAVTLSYCISNAIIFAGGLWYHVRKFDLRIYERNLVLFASAMAVCAIILFFGKDTILIAIAKLLVLVAWIFFFSRRSERSRVIRKVMKKFAFGR